jgi:putative addiction module component (TIGR02574 family)
MGGQVAKVLEEALRLPEADRGDIAVRLIESLDPDRDEDVDAAWAEEIRSRIADLESGRVKAVGWTDACRMILDDAN